MSNPLPSTTASVGPKVLPSSSSVAVGADVLVAADPLKIALEEVVLGDAHVLRPFTLTNLTQDPCRITLRSNLGNQLTFQLENENMSSNNEGPSVESDVNELFNEINEIDEFELPGGARQVVIVGFKPDVRDYEQRVQAQKEGTGPKSIELLHNDAHLELFPKLKLDGKITIVASKLSTTQTQSIPSTPSSADGGPYSRNESLDTAPLHPENSEVNSREDSVSSHGATTTHTLTVKFRSYVCSSVMYLDPVDTDIALEECPVGGYCERDFTISNQSDVSLHYALTFMRASDSFGTLEFQAIANGEKRPMGTVDPHSQIVVRLAFRPIKIGELSAQVQLSNLKNPTNQYLISVHGIVTPSEKEDAVLIQQPLLDFGECYTENKSYSQQLTLRNIKDEPFDVDLRTGIPHEITFHLGTSDLPDHSGPATISSPMPSLRARRSTTDLQIESYCHEINLPAGRHKSVTVMFHPSNADSPIAEESQYRLTKKKLKLQLKIKNAAGEVVEIKPVQCVARMCVSKVSVSTNLINFGDVHLKTTVSQTIQISNNSEIAASLNIKIRSRIIQTDSKSILIPPLQTVDVKFDISPDHLDPDFQSQIVVFNAYNKADVHTINVRSNNIDRVGDLMHSDFFTLTTSGTSNYISFGNIVANDLSLRSFQVKNITNQTINLKMTSDREDIKLYVQNLSARPTAEKQTSVPSERIESFEMQLQDKLNKPLKPLTEDPLKSSRPRSSFDKVDYLDLAKPQLLAGSVSPLARRGSVSLPRVKSNPSLTDLSKLPTSLHASSSTLYSPGSISSNEGPMSNPSNSLLNFAPKSPGTSQSVALPSLLPYTGLSIDVDELTTSFESDPMRSPQESLFLKDEERIVATYISRARTLHDAVRQERLVPLAENQLSIFAQDKVVVYVLYSPKESSLNLSSTPEKKFKGDGTITISLLRDFSLEENADEAETRVIHIRAKIYISAMALAQKFINFGKMNTNETRSKYLLLSNTCEIPLMYKIRKSMSVASGDIHFGNGKIGIIAPFSSRKVSFEFKPGMPGSFLEHITVENICNRENTQVIQMKASILQPPAFEVSPDHIDFENIMIRSKSTSQLITLTNTSHKARYFVFQHASPNEPYFRFRVQLFFELSGTDLKMLSKEAYEAIEKLEQKLKVATRKNQPKKIDKITKQLEKLRAGEMIGNDPSDSEYSESEDESSSSHKGSRVSKVPDNSDLFIVCVQSHRVQKVGVSLLITPLNEKVMDQQRVSSRFSVYEKTNMDYVKTISISGIVHTERKNLVINEVSSVNLAPPHHTPMARNPSNSTPLIKDPNACVLTVAPLNIDFGDILMTEKQSGSFTILNGHPFDAPFALTDQPGSLGPTPLSFGAPGKPIYNHVLSFGYRHGRLLPLTQQHIGFTFKPLKPGKQKHKICITCIPCRAVKVVSIMANPHPPQIISFPNHPKELIDFGMCFLNKQIKFVRFERLSIKNLSDSKILVSCTTNLPQQISISSDMDSKNNCEKLLFLPHQQKAVFVFLHPTLTEEATRSGHCRTIEGGIQVKVSSADDIPSSTEGENQDSFTWTKTTLKIRALVGMSALKVSTRVLKLGAGIILGNEFKGSFSIINPSNGLPLRFELIAPDALKLSVQRGELPPNQSIVVNVSCRGRQYGLMHHSILVKNLSGINSETVHTICFLDDDTFHTDIENDLKGIRALDFGTVYVVNNGVQSGSPTTPMLTSTPSVMTPAMNNDNLPGESPIIQIDGKGKYGILGLMPSTLASHQSRILREAPLITQDKTFLLFSKTSSEVQLVPKSDINVSVRFGNIYGVNGKLLEPLQNFLQAPPEETNNSASSSGQLSMHVCGPRVTVPPYAVVEVIVQCPLPPEWKPRKQQQLDSGQPLPYSGSLFLEAVSVKQPVGKGTRLLKEVEKASGTTMNVVKMFDIGVKYCISIAEITPNAIDMRRIGYHNSWRTESFHFKIVNVTSLPLVFKFLNIPSCLEVSYKPPESDVPFSIRSSNSEACIMALAGGQEIHFSCSLNPSLLEDPARPGERLLELTAVNCYNPRNVLLCKINASLSVFPLRFSHLSTSGAVMVAEIPYPIMKASSDVWFSVNWVPNGPDEYSHFKVLASANPILKDLFLLELMTRSTNNALQELVMSDAAAKEIRLRVTLNYGMGPLMPTTGAFPSNMNPSTRSPSRSLFNNPSTFTRTPAVPSSPGAQPSDDPFMFARFAGKGKPDSAPRPLPGSTLPSPNLQNAPPRPSLLDLMRTLGVSDLSVPVSLGEITFAAFDPMNPADSLPPSKIPINAILKEVSTFSLNPSKLQLYVSSRHPDSSDTDSDSEVSEINNPESSSSRQSSKKKRSLPQPSTRKQSSDDIFSEESVTTAFPNAESLDSTFFVVANESSSFPLNFEIKMEFVGEVSSGSNLKPEDILALEYPPTAPPSGQTKVLVRIRDDKVEFRGTVAMVVRDVLALTFTQRVEVAIIPGFETHQRGDKGRKDKGATSASLSDPSLPPFASRPSSARDHKHTRHLEVIQQFPTLRLDGVENPPLVSSAQLSSSTNEGAFLHSLDLGKLAMGGGMIKHEVPIHNLGPGALHYKICIRESTRTPWLTLNKTEGTLQQDEVHALVIRTTTSTPGRYLAYLVVENLSNPSDVKMLRLSMEVTSSRVHTKIEDQLFSISTPSILPDGHANTHGVLHMGTVFYNKLCTQSSFLITNKCQSTLEFFLSHNLPASDPSELLFASSCLTPSALFTSVSIPPNSSLQVFVHLLPRSFPSEAMGSNTNHSRTRLTGESDEDFISSNNGGLLVPREIMSRSEESSKVLQIFVNCHAIRSFQKVITVKGEIRYPVLEVPLPHLTLRFDLPSRMELLDLKMKDVGLREDKIDLLQEFLAPRKVVVKSRIACQLGFQSSSGYFSASVLPCESRHCKGASNGCECGTTHVVLVTPLLEDIKRNVKQLLLRNRYKTEMIAITNDQDEREVVRLTIELRCGELDSFIGAPPFLLGEAFVLLERRVFNFVRDFHSATLGFDGSESSHSSIPLSLTPLLSSLYYLVEDLIYFTLIAHEGKGPDFPDLFAHVLFQTVFDSILFRPLTPKSSLSSALSQSQPPQSTPGTPVTPLLAGTPSPYIFANMATTTSNPPSSSSSSANKEAVGLKELPLSEPPLLPDDPVDLLLVKWGEARMRWVQILLRYSSIVFLPPTSTLKTLLSTILLPPPPQQQQQSSSGFNSTFGSSQP